MSGHVHTFNESYQRVGTGPRPPLQLGWVSVQLFGSHPNAIAVFTSAQKIRTKEGNEPEFDSTELNKTNTLSQFFHFVLSNYSYKVLHAQIKID